MATNSRSQRITQLLKVLSKTFEPVGPVDRPVLEHLLYACCLENSTPEIADEAFAKIQELYFDWNEIRVTSIKELSEVMNRLSDPVAAATRLTQCLQSVFESKYSFEIEELKKKNLGKAVDILKSIRGTTGFSVRYVAQHGLEGHSIPVNTGLYGALEVVGIITASETAAGRVPGLERAIPKKKGAKTASLLHQLGTFFHQSPYSKQLRELLLSIAPDAKDRLPKRPSKKPVAKPESKPKAAAKSKAKKGRSTEKVTAAKGKTKPPVKKKKTAKAAAPKKTTAARSGKKKKPTPKSVKKKTPAKKKPAAGKKKATRKTSSKSATKSPGRRKPK